MTTRALTIEPLEGDDVDSAIALLQANDLPTQDVRAKSESLYAAYVDREFVGVGGVEIHGEAGLLRSVVVAESMRGEGYGATICDALEQRAGAAGVETLYLLTTTATGFFERHGYEVTDRSGVPEPVRRTREFTDLCPSTATCLEKDLDG